MTGLRLETLAQAREAVRALGREAALPAGKWTLAQALDHCAASIDASMKGFPVMRPAIVRATIGRLVLRRFLGQGRMSHDRESQVPGLDAPADAPLEAAVGRLVRAIDEFERYPGAMAPHFVYGPVTKDEYARLHAMHIADHLSAIARPVSG
jgi:hypothetical protein